MYVVVQHRFKDFEAVKRRGERLTKGEGAPQGVRGLEFYPSRDGKLATCLWEANSIADVQLYVDETLGDASENSYFEVNPELAYAERPSKIPGPPGRAERAA